jgi:hypothetical protein
MTRAQILLPDELYQRAKRFASSRELSLAEVARRGLEQFLDRFPEAPAAEWQLPAVDGGGLRVALEELRDLAADDAVRSRRARR